MKQLPLFKIYLVLLIINSMVNTAMAQGIDDFSYSQSLIFAFGEGSSSSSTVTDPNVPSSILGGERDVFIEVVSGTDIVSSRVESGTFSFSTSAGTVGRFYISWDGIDGLGDIANLDHTGLGGEDLTLIGNSILLTVNSADIAGDMTFEVFTDVSNSSTYTQAFPIINSPTTYTIPFSSFNTNTGTGADFTNVGAITLTATGASLDITADILDIIQVVLPTDETVEVTMNANECPYPQAIYSLVADPNRDNPPVTPGSDFSIHGSTFQAPTIFGNNCSDAELYAHEIIEEAEGSTAPCTRIIRVVWRTYDECNNFTERNQKFTISIEEGPQIAVVPDLTVDCFEAINPNPAWASVVTTCDVPFNTEVELIAQNEEMENCQGRNYTYRYTVTDACGRSAFADQTYHIENEGPTMDCPDNCEVFGCFDGQADVVIQAWLNTVAATSSCSDALTVTNDYDGINGVCIYNGFTPVTFAATDDCDRTVTCESLIIIMDDDAPEISGNPGDLLVPCTANTDEALAAWLANHGGLSAYDECSTVSWSTDPAFNEIMNQLDCEGGPQAIIVEFIATDECGNSSSVAGVFNTKSLPPSVNVAGLIQTEAAEAVASVEVAAYQSGGMTAMDVSDDTGDYDFEALPFDEDTEIVPARDSDWLNGLSTYDLILLQQHILGLQELDSPYKRIAADLNRNGHISTLDLVMLRRLILHLDEAIEVNTSWRFVDADFVFPNPADPFETAFPEAYNLSGEEEDWASFIAVKIGDLNLDAATNSFNADADDRSGLEDLVFQIEDQKLQAGEEYEIEIKAENFNNIRGFQMTLEYDHSLISVLDINGDALPEFSTANVNLAFAEEGSVPVSWNHTTGQELSSEDAALRVIIKAKADLDLSEALTITSSLTRAEAYSDTELMNVALNFTNNDTSVVKDKFQLFQNQPNPFKDATMIGFVLPEDSEVLLEIFDVNGRLIHSQRGDFAKGYQQIDLNRVDLPSGILYYQVSTAKESASKKMIVLD